ncbi:hypothetical protein DM01DRAFT_1386925 [Hesseltinella vesiculosa]|uniref:Uncharacterized protein n=1 Tax=Hesseltinella vesiculosa TaxID=101127 RepID=A0A1X2G436_9FUNG|nr:hypothetical protein DM01DRAFT_1386925 [Hesseltinella vesiculosa]
MENGVSPPTDGYEHAFLEALQESNTSDQSKKRSLLFAEYYDVVPATIADANGNQASVLLSPKSLSQLQSLVTSGQPLTFHAHTTKRPRTIEYPAITDISSIAENGRLTAFVKSCKYQELNDQIIAVLNQDWTTSANQPFAVAMAFTGAILIDEERKCGLLITTLEIYGRDTYNDNHAEKATASRVQSSLPELNTRYKDLFIGTVNQAEGSVSVTKLMIGSFAFNILITGSIRIDSRLDAECGPNTNSFQIDGARNSCKVFIDDNSWASACKIAENKLTNMNSIHPHSRLMQIRQLRTKFDEIFTYNAFRSSLFHAPRLQPYTIYTFCKSTSKPNGGTIASTLFAHIARQVIMDGQFADLDKITVDGLFKKLEKSKVVKDLFSSILNLYNENDKIKIIGNSPLNKILEQLASFLSPRISTFNKKNVVPAITEHLLTY